jgi:hypothetical protein
MHSLVKAKKKDVGSQVCPTGASKNGHLKLFEAFTQVIILTTGAVVSLPTYHLTVAFAKKTSSKYAWHGVAHQIDNHYRVPR